MKVRISLKNIDLIELFDKAINLKNRINLFVDLRRMFIQSIEKQLIEQGVEIGKFNVSDSTNLLSGKVQIFSTIESPSGKKLNHEFCAGYGHSIYSLEAINYQYGLSSDYYSLKTFYLNENFSIGNILIPIKTKELEILLEISENIKIVGVSENTGKNKKKPFIAFIGITFLHSSLKPIFDKYLHDYENPILDEIKLNTVSYPILFTCRKSGRIFSCTCFKEHIDWENDFYRFSPKLDNNPEIKTEIENIEYLDNVCHMCTGTTPLLEYGQKMYYSGFLVRFLPYYHLINKKREQTIFHFDKDDNFKTENELRELFDFYKIGEKWTSETMLFNIVKELFPENAVIFHYRGKELQGLELDIWLPELKIGFEYQGEQHYKVVSNWGGESGLLKRKENDRKKKEICKGLNYQLIELTYKEELSKETVIKKIEELNE